MLFELIGRKVSGKQAAWEMIKLVLSSKSRLAIVPMQDVLGLGAQARMNLPATTKNNWIWRLSAGQKQPQINKKLAGLTVTYLRAKT